jgi:hypothetical protein
MDDYIGLEIEVQDSELAGWVPDDVANSGFNMDDLEVLSEESIRLVLISVDRMDVLSSVEVPELEVFACLANATSDVDCLPAILCFA